MGSDVGSEARMLPNSLQGTFLSSKGCSKESSLLLKASPQAKDQSDLLSLRMDEKCTVLFDILTLLYIYRWEHFNLKLKNHHAIFLTHRTHNSWLIRSIKYHYNIEVNFSNFSILIVNIPMTRIRTQNFEANSWSELRESDHSDNCTGNKLKSKLNINAGCW